MDRGLVAGTNSKMTGIQVAALITSLIAFAAFGGLIWQLSDAKDRRWLLGLIVLGIPLSPLAYHCLRLPMHSILATWLGSDSRLLAFCQLWYAPVTEEPAKLLPLLLLIPMVGYRMTGANLVPVAMSLGLGFAIGEMWLVASLVGHSPEIAKLPFYQFGGFFNERLATCITHAGFTSLALWGIQRGRLKMIAGMAGAMTFHFLGNFPIFLMNTDFAGLGKPVWVSLVSIWLLICVVFAALLLAILHAGTKRVFAMMVTGQMKCPECGQFYRQPILGGNFGMWRYEPCGACHKWHWISLKEIQ